MVTYVAMHKWVFAAVASLFLSALPCRAQDDADASKDHPMFSRMPGYYIDDYDVNDFGALDLEVEPGKHVEGKFWQISYRIKEGARRFGPLQIGRNYTDLVLKQGGKRLGETVNTSGGTSVAQLPRAGRNIWIQVSISDRGDYYELAIVEEALMEQKVEFTATELARLLNDKGSVALHNILFDTGKATLKPDSAAALAPVGDLLKNDSSLKLEIQGHTDNVGGTAANLKLSQDRAAAVKAYLVQNAGVGSERLTTTGFGDAQAVGDNKTDEGRAQNRRVELVKK
jgi:outer membrane protein OmpA-like peptidoglycan-associated protein